MKKPEEIKKGLECCTNPSCDGCPYEKTLDCKGKNADALALIKQLEQIVADFAERTAQLEALVGKDTNVPRWISAKERLPENGDLVFVIANGKPKSHITLVNACLIASYWKDEGWIADGFEGWEPVDVTHWMLLPEPPKE